MLLAVSGDGPSALEPREPWCAAARPRGQPVREPESEGRGIGRHEQLAEW